MQFDYDHDNRSVKMVCPNGDAVQFGYDGVGYRVLRREGVSVRYLYFDGDKC